MGFLSVLSQAQRFVTERVRPGDIVIDATAGNGVDTLFLSKLVGAGGKVFAFDVQPDALEHTRKRLESVRDQEALAPVTLLHTGHEHIAESIPDTCHGQVAAVMFNLGYLPGGEHSVTTMPPTTLIALQAALKLLRTGGILTAIVYPGHQGGDEEAQAVEAWASGVSSLTAQSVIYRFPQKQAAPFLVALNKR
ncbi:SAM-dependent methyltransferase [Cohnella kolymensis]|uniref:SAM-dependent methyltransferase n=1 Tax=Cohnella kolymensis TaxID=1590652 RepID=A0ABR5A4R0_9BACL|nr:class I SAM-dependent methyltransferase [Cohnella kolymensis]KIL35917.1 SAM-dependent methyltransferase [Cohnella kolymensis]